MPRIARASKPLPADRADRHDIDRNADDVDHAPFVHKHSAAAVAGVHKPAGVAASVFDAARLAKAAQRLTRVSFDPAAIAIDSGLAPPDGCTRNHTGWAYRALRERMQPGDSVVLPDKEAAGYRTFLRKAGDGTRAQRAAPDRMRVWLVERAMSMTDEAAVQP